MGWRLFLVVLCFVLLVGLLDGVSFLCLSCVCLLCWRWICVTVCVIVVFIRGCNSVGSPVVGWRCVIVRGLHLVLVWWFYFFFCFYQL